MGEKTKIDYADSTWSPWIGCHKCDQNGVLREGCRHCYAEMWSRRNPRFRGHWGKDAPRYFFGDEHWQQPLRWQRKCERLGKRKRVLVSLCDPFEISVRAADEQIRERRRLWYMIRKTPLLDWLVLTKRPGNMQPWRLPERNDLATGEPLPLLPNLWRGVSCWDQASADKMIPPLLEVLAALHWVSFEPLLGPVQMRAEWLAKLGWLVVGCESRGARPGRPCDLAWVERLQRQCDAARVPIFVKQLPEYGTGGGRLIKSQELAAKGWPVQMPTRSS